MSSVCPALNPALIQPLVRRRLAPSHDTVSSVYVNAFYLFLLTTTRSVAPHKETRFKRLSSGQGPTAVEHSCATHCFFRLQDE